MTVIDDPFEPNDPSDAALDRLLAQARWPEASIEVEDRLRERWEGLSRRRRMAMPIYAMLAAAASILLVAGTMFLVRDHASLIAIVPVQQEATDVKYLMVRAELTTPRPHVESRPATWLEQLTLMQASPAAVAVVMPNESPQPDPAVVALTEQLGDENLEKRFAAAQALAEMDDPTIVPALANMVRQGINAREALLALKLSKSPAATQTLEGLALSSASRAQLAADTLEIQSGL